MELDTPLTPLMENFLDEPPNLYLWHAMWFHAEKLLKHSFESRWFRYMIWAPESWPQKSPKNDSHNRDLLKYLHILGPMPPSGRRT